MTRSEPSREWQDQQHHRILQNDPIAFAELCELFLPLLASFLRAQFPQYDSHLHEMAAIDCLLDYYARPQQFDPQRLSLFAYLRMAAKRDTLNAIDKKKRLEQRLSNIDDPSIRNQLPGQNTIEEQAELDEWLQEHTVLSRQEIIEALATELTEVDKQILLLILDGVRESKQYAEIMGIDHNDLGQQRKEVKRAKDRIVKKLRRFGRRIDNA